MPVLRKRQRLYYGDQVEHDEEHLSEEELCKYGHVFATPQYLADIAASKFADYQDLVPGKIVLFNDNAHKLKTIKALNQLRSIEIYKDIYITAETVATQLKAMKEGIQ